MIFTGSIKVPAPRAAVFEKLNNPQFFASCVSGVENLEELSPTHYKAELATRIAYIRFRFEISVEIVEQVAPERVVAKAEGKPIGAVGRLSSVSSVTLSDVDGGTEATYEIDLSLAGKLGSIGQPVLKSKAREMEREFSANLIAAFTQEEATV
ncbi:MAG: SRPBCC domain-containing protein [Alphaproteobacteria bacterium]|jgi:hypothetical protein|nr:hypothetical protein [Alphaproteobacteria bacterium]MBO6861997.1 hypothetical protein [Alphaproteobacteria bacterium]MEC9265334.1 SRPBCC domain-containing protein [Pseudomonadota bacterium]